MSKYCSIFHFVFLSILDVLCYPWKGPAGMHYPSLNKPPWAVSDWEKHLASLVSWSEFYLFWRLGWLTAWTAVSSLLLWMVQQHWKAACAWILLSVLAHQPLWCCGLWIGLCGSVLFSLLFSPACFWQMTGKQRLQKITKGQEGWDLQCSLFHCL